MVKRQARKPVVRRPRKAMIRRPRRKFNVPEWASASQNILTQVDAVNTIYNFDTLKLSDFDRLAQIAKGYQYFRFTGVEIRFKPLADTFATGSTMAISYLYWLINKGENNLVAEFNALRDAGAKPIRFDDKTIVVKYKPAVLQFVRDVEAGTGTRVPNYSMSKVSPWLATNNAAGLGGTIWTPNAVEHCGLLYGVSALGPSAAQQVYMTEVIVHAQFMKPLNQPGLGPNESAPVAVRKFVLPLTEEAKPEGV